MAQRAIGEMIKIARINLDQENPRHEPYATQDEAIAYLCKDEYVPALARDIAKHGLNPLEMLAVLPGKAKNSFVAAEGNRRLCAIKLLNDPDRAPPNLRKSFEKLSKNWQPITEVPCVKFESRAQVQLWLDRVHQGLNGGVGRKDWNADQKARNSGEKKNKTALAVLDYAEENGLITSEQRKKKLTTVQRYMSNPLMREALGIDLSDPDEVGVNRPKQDFDLLLRTFTEDLLSDDKDSEVTSRKNKEDISAYARKLSRTGGLTGQTIESEPITRPTAVTEIEAKPEKPKPKNPTPPTKINYDEEIAAKLEQLKNFKLQNLYYSICDVSLKNHTPLIAVGVWSFMESLAKKMGSDNDFYSYFNAGRLSLLGLGDKQKTAGLRQAIQRISHYGNTTKHDEESANFNAPQLANDMDKMCQFLKVCLDEVLSKK
ncbi:hypothetical protein [Brucella sp. BZ]|uniref:hypothetical protein n=1 Tax=Brucella sp. BZ TaxID=3381346 RepID=UPI0039E9C3DB